jgi:hypothetical protein
VNGSKEREQPRLKWQDLSVNARAALARKLEGLYGQSGDESIFNSLAIDKQQALLILARHLGALKLWDGVQRIENLYGEGGVGMMFVAWPLIQSTLERRTDFTRLLARHRNTTCGFIERRRRLASLHILKRESEACEWEAHFDLYNPFASPLNAWRHLLHEKIRGVRPDWRVIGDALGYLDKSTVVLVKSD